MTTRASAPGVPADYYRRIRDAEQLHWWYRGMREISRALLADRFGKGGRVLDAGCGTGGVLRWLLDEGGFTQGAGVDIGADAIELAQERVPEADLRVAPLSSLPFEDASFDLVVTNDVLQHVDEGEVDQSLRELRRVLAPGGALLLRTNGARRTRRERSDWRAYDMQTLRAALEHAGFRCERLTYANTVLSAWAVATGRTPHAPSDEHHGIPLETPTGLKSDVGLKMLQAEARLLARRDARLPYGHTLFALAVPALP